MKVDHDLQLEKMKKEIDYDGSNHLAEVEKKDASINKLNEENDKLKVELEMIKDELSAKTEEVEELQTDLEVKEAGFNNRYICQLYKNYIEGTLHLCWFLAVGSLTHELRRKKVLLQDEEMHKMTTTISLKIVEVVILSDFFCHFVSCSACKLEISHVLNGPTAKNQHRGPYLLARRFL